MACGDDYCAGSHDGNKVSGGDRANEIRVSLNISDYFVCQALLTGQRMTLTIIALHHSATRRDTLAL